MNFFSLKDLEQILLNHNISFEKITIGRAQGKTLYGLICDDKNYYAERLCICGVTAFKEVIHYISRDAAANHTLLVEDEVG